MVILSFFLHILPSSREEKRGVGERDGEGEERERGGEG